MIIFFSQVYTLSVRRKKTNKQKSLCMCVGCISPTYCFLCGRASCVEPRCVCAAFINFIQHRSSLLYRTHFTCKVHPKTISGLDNISIKLSIEPRQKIQLRNLKFCVFRLGTVEPTGACLSSERETDKERENTHIHTYTHTHTHA